MSTLRAAAQQALEALEQFAETKLVRTSGVITALRTALAEPEQVCVLWERKDGGKTGLTAWTGYDLAIDVVPPQRKPLKYEEIDLLAVKHAPPIDPDFGDDDWIEFARAIERAHGIGCEA